MIEKWKAVPGYDEYQISNLSRVRRNGRILKPYLDKRGYYRLCFKVTKQGKPKYIGRGRAVAITWIPNPQNKKEVNHKNGIKTDDSIKNLEWATPSENINHYYYTLRKGTIRKVVQMDMQGNFIKEWPSASMAARSVNGSVGNLIITCQGKNYYAYGFKWKYAE